MRPETGFAVSWPVLSSQMTFEKSFLSTPVSSRSHHTKVVSGHQELRGLRWSVTITHAFLPQIAVVEPVRISVLCQMLRMTSSETRHRGVSVLRGPQS